MPCSKQGGRTVTALVVDDDAGLRLVARAALMKHGFHVTLVETGEEALDVYAASRPDVVILDIYLPGIDGFEVSRNLHELYGDLTVPILMITAMNDRDAMLRGYQAGATDFLHKPLEWEVVVNRSLAAVNAHRDKLDLRQSESMLRRAQRVARMGSWEYDALSGETIWSEEAKRIIGLKPDRRETPSEIMQLRIFPEDQQRVLRAFRESLDLRKSFSVEHRILLPDGDVRHVRQLAEPTDERSGNGNLWVGTIQDITDQAEALERILFLANYDSLTGLSNRSLFTRQLSESVEFARVAERHVGVILFDIDRFKRVNDIFGHTAGDQLLRIVVRRIQDVIRISDQLGRADATEKRSTMGRSAGNEFMLLLPDIGRSKDVPLVTDRILAALQDPFELGGGDVAITGSVGVAIYPRDGLGVETLIRNAETALNCAKGCGGNNVRFFSDSKTTELIKKIAMEEQLRLALERDEFELYYQPKVELQTGAVVGFEGLLRWRNRELGLVSPAEFIPIAEETGLIEPIGQWVIEAACRTAKKWQDAGLRQVPIAVNVSTHQFGREDLYEFVTGALAENELEPCWLDVEITESALMQDEDVSVATLRRLQEVGVRIAIDDFGTGYSSLSSLKSFPLDALKIDRSFIVDLTQDRDSAGIVQAIIVMAKVLGLTVIAEGVETKGQRDFLSFFGCDQIQGFLVSPACREEDAVRFLEPELSVFEEDFDDRRNADDGELKSEVVALERRR